MNYCQPSPKTVGSGILEFYYKGFLIRVPSYLNHIARHKSDSFWDWLISKYHNSKYIGLCYMDIDEESAFRRYA